ncbi:lipase [Stylonychia lemnae]|uniref:Lipase n=1 Tax=Stylonychia lemnae TaxID=5949 RepID=A0A078A3B9_STYLE|nr:lipase [Stylonychia lemnae]|eukprot:CDW76003.1 lipase [Stylonychia lemnae]
MKSSPTKLAVLSTVLLSSLSLASAQNSTYKRGLTDHFIGYLGATKNYYPYHFNRTDFFGGSFGGKDNDSTPITKVPVIFIHGAADQIIGEEWANNGFRYSIEYFLQQGYTKAELYGSMWGFADLFYEYNLVHNSEWILQIRKFIEAVIDYTGAEKVNIIAHSMGVTLSRAAIKGGKYSIGDDQEIDLGEPINEFIQTYVAIAGGNYGVSICNIQFYYDAFRICNNQTGFFPGTQDDKPQCKDISKFLGRLNKNKIKEGDYTYALLSLYDQVVPPVVFNRYTSFFPTMDQGFIFNSSEYDHVGVRDLTANVQYVLVNQHYFTPSQGENVFLYANSDEKQDIKVFLQ